MSSILGEQSVQPLEREVGGYGASVTWRGITTQLLILPGAHFLLNCSVDNISLSLY